MATTASPTLEPSAFRVSEYGARLVARIFTAASCPACPCCWKAAVSSSTRAFASAWYCAQMPRAPATTAIPAVHGFVSAASSRAPDACITAPIPPASATAVRNAISLGAATSAAAPRKPTATAVALTGSGSAPKAFAIGRTTDTSPVSAGTSAPPTASWMSSNARPRDLICPPAVCANASPAPPTFSSSRPMIVARSAARSPVGVNWMPSSLSARALPISALPRVSAAAGASLPVTVA